MKGKYIYLSVSELNNSERHKILAQCRKSDDKRARVLYDYIRSNPQNEEQHLTALEELKKGLGLLEDTPENDKALRRFLDYAIKTIEDLKIKIFLSSNYKYRNFLLSRVYANGNASEILGQYIKKTKLAAEKENDLDFLSFCLDFEINKLVKGQKTKELKALKELLVQKDKLTQEIYHEKLSSVHNTLSGMYMSNKNLFESLSKEIMHRDKELSALSEMSAGSKEAVVYKLSQARYQFLNMNAFNQYLEEAEALLYQSVPETKDFLKAKRKLAFLRVLGGFQYGADLHVLLAYADEVIQLNEQFNYKDALAAFFNLFIHFLLHGENHSFNEKFEKYSELYFEPENAFIFTFIDALIYQKNNEKGKLLRALSDLTYAPNIYITIWSRLMEIRLHYEKGDLSFCETLINRLQRLIKSNEGALFTHDSNQYILSRLVLLIGHKNIKEPKPIQLTPFHIEFNNWIDEQLN